MKRTALQRRTPLKRTALARPTKPMRRVSQKLARQKRQANPARAKYVASVWLCQCCGERQAEDCHEIATRAQSSVAIEHRCCWLAVCRRCHDELTDYAKWPLTRQLYRKLLCDPKHFDLAKFNQLRGRSAGAITTDEVREWSHG